VNKKIFVGGLLSLEPHRLENGNIGNWYITSAILSQFKNYEVYTSWQISQKTLERLNISNIQILDEVELEKKVKKSTRDSLYIDIHGDLMGDNSQLLGEGRLLESVERTMRIQNYVSTAFLASSPGPFENCNEILNLIKKCYSQYNYISLREPSSYDLLKDLNFDLSKTVIRPCPSVLFQERVNNQEFMQDFNTFQKKSSKKIVGLALSNWNLPVESFWNEKVSEDSLMKITKLIKILLRLDLSVALISHSNGFKTHPDGSIYSTPGRDRKLIDQILRIPDVRTFKNRIFTAPDMRPREMYNFLGKLDAILAGRVHAGLAALSQGVPTLFIDYATGPLAHKTKGFSQLGLYKKLIKLTDDTTSLTQVLEDFFNNASDSKRDYIINAKTLKEDSFLQFNELTQLDSTNTALK
jgi:colanic acid/amylovoran biosynthesis protein